MFFLPCDDEIKHAMLIDGVRFYAENGSVMTARALQNNHNRVYPNCKYCVDFNLEGLSHVHKRDSNRLFHENDVPVSSAELMQGKPMVLHTSMGDLISIKSLSPAMLKELGLIEQD
jgi:hypothetical protein